MLSITELKKGTLVQLDGLPYRVVDYSQKVMGRGGSIVNVRLKNLIDNSVLSKTFKGNEKLTPADVTTSQAQYLYRDTDNFYFMDGVSYDQFSLNDKLVDDSARFLKEGMTVSVQHFDGRVIAIELPIKASYQVADAEPGIKGDTVSNITKAATIETGASIQVPIFISPGDMVVIDTRDGSYVERAK